MKKSLLIFLSAIFCSLFCRAQQAPPNWMWFDGSGGQSWQYACGIGTDDSGFHYISGRFASTITFQGASGPVNLVGGGNVTPFVGKFDESGNCLWLSQQPFGWDYPRGFCTDKALKNNEYVTGNTNSGDGFFLYKFRNTGVLDWALNYANNFNGYGSAPNGDGVVADSSGNVYVVGETGAGSYTFGDSTLTCGTNTNWPQAQESFLTKVDSSGHFLWAVGVRGNDVANEGYDVGRAVVLDKTDAYVYAAGGFQDTTVFHSKFSTGDTTIVGPVGTASNLYLAKYDTAGDLLWVATATNAGLQWISGFNSGVGATYGLSIDSCGNTYIIGNFSGTVTFGPFTLTAKGTNDVFVATCNNMGQWQWVDDFGEAGSSTGGGTVALDKNNDVYVGGSFTGTSNFGSGISMTAASPTGSLFFAKLANSTGATQWAQTSLGTSQSSVAGIAIDTQKFVYINGSFNGTMTLGGTTISATTNEGNIFIAKLDTVPTLYIVPQVDSTYCAGGTYTLNYTVSGGFNSGNVFTVQLSDSTGSFVTAQNIGSTNSSTSGTISITIPVNASGSNYLIRVVSSSPAASSYVNGCGAYYQPNVYINDFYIKIGAGGTITPIVTKDTTICPGASINLTASGGSSYLWSNGDTSSVITVTPTTTDSVFKVSVKGACGSAVDSVVVSFNTSVQQLNVIPADTGFCDGLSATLYVTGGGTGYVWIPTQGISDSTLSGDSITVNPTTTTTYTVTGLSSGGCAALGTSIVNIIPSPNTPTFTQVGDTLFSSSTYDNQWYYNGNLLSNDTSHFIIITTPGEYLVNVTNEANGCSTASDSMYVDTVAGIAQITLRHDILIYPNPFNGNIFIQINSSAQNIRTWNLQVTDVLGRTIYSRLSLNYSNDIDFSDLPSGVYFITIVNNTARAVFPVVKQN